MAARMWICPCWSKNPEANPFSGSCGGPSGDDFMAIQVLDGPYAGYLNSGTPSETEGTMRVMSANSRNHVLSRVLKNEAP